MGLFSGTDEVQTLQAIHRYFEKFHGHLCETLFPVPQHGVRPWSPPTHTLGPLARLLSPVHAP